MAHKIHVDVLDENGEIVGKARNHACDSIVKPINFPKGQIWKRYIEVENCIYSKKDVKKWIDFVSKCGWKCSLNKNIEELELVTKQYDNKYKEIEPLIRKVNCYIIILERKDYKSDLDLFIGNTIIRMISYDLDPNYEKIPQIVFDIKMKIDPLKKLMLAMQTFNLDGGHDLFYRTSYYDREKNQCIRYANALLSSKNLILNDSVNTTFGKSAAPILESEITKLMQEKNYKQAYKLLKDK